jgi:hypothetical protein
MVRAKSYLQMVINIQDHISKANLMEKVVMIGQMVVTFKDHLWVG